METALEYIPPSLRFMLQHLLVRKDTWGKVSSIGHTIIQIVRSKTVIAPLQLGLPVQMQHHFRFQFLIDIISAMSYCISYSEMQRFEENATSTVALDVLSGQIALSEKMLLFAADNVDHNIVTIDGKSTFHGKGMIAGVTPNRQVSYTVLREKICKLTITCETKIPIKEYHLSKHTYCSIKFLTPAIAD